jgi:RNA polymerase sigma factor (sigma-70 family)
MMKAMDPDLVLLDRWRAGDQQAGQALFSKHFGDIYRFFEHKVGVEADDLSQRTFLACTAAREQFRAQSSFRTYLYVIARHELYAHLRRLRAQAAVDFAVTSIAEVVTSASRRLDRAREVEHLREALGSLPAEQQLLLELHYWHELDAAALAEVFDAPAGTIRVRLLRARQALRDRFQHAGRPAAPVRGDRLSESLSFPDLEEVPHTDPVP